MARYLGPKAKLSRREGTDLFLKSARRSIADKSKFDSKPGQHGRTSGQRTSDYGLQLREKQKVKRMYGILEKQFRRYFEAADRRKGNTGANLLSLLECRLDNLVYRLGFARSIRQARQIVTHGHILLNGKKVNIPSQAVKESDVISLCEQSRKNPVLANNFQELHPFGLSYLEKNPDQYSGKLVRFPLREEIPVDVNEILVIEHYSQ